MKGQSTGSKKSKSTRCASDYSGVVKTVLKSSQHYFRCLIFTEDAFPDDDNELEFATRSWTHQCHRRNMDLELDEDQLKLVELSLLFL